MTDRPKKTVCVDFDGVLNTYDGWKGEDELFEPREGAKEFLEALVAKGYEVKIHTTRNAGLIDAWLRAHGMNEFVAGIFNIKPPAVAYIDDRAIRFEGSYEQALGQVEREPYWKRDEDEPTDPGFVRPFGANEKAQEESGSTKTEEGAD